MALHLRAARSALKLGLVLGAFSSLIGFGRVADANTAPSPSSLALRAASSALAGAGTAAPRTAVATGTVELPPGAAGEPGRPRLAQTEYDYGRARRMNADLAFSKAPILPAEPFTLTGAEGDKARALTCMTQAIYYEAGFEPTQGQRAVAQVVLNRMRHAIFPHSVCGVVFQGAVTPGGGCQFSFTCDGALTRGAPAVAAWRRAQDVARAALAGYVERSVGLATHYHTDYVAPYWMTTVTKMARVGQHIFYRWPGRVGLPDAFHAQYAAVERIPSMTLLASAARIREASGLSAMARAFTPGNGVTMGADGAIYVAEAGDTPKDGRVHTRFLMNGETSEPATAATPTARRAALLAGHGGAPAGALDSLLSPAPVGVPFKPETSLAADSPSDAK